MIKNYFNGLAVIGLIGASLGLAACGHTERVTRTTTTEQTTAVVPAEPVPAPAQTTTTTTTQKTY